MRRQLLLAALFASLATTIVSASDQVGHWYVNPQVGKAFPDSDRRVNDDVTYGLGVGLHLTELLSVEINGLTATHNGEPGFSNLDTGTVTADGLLVFNRGSRFSPYLTAGAGWMQNNPAGVSNTQDDFMMQAGVGAFLQVWTNASGSSEFGLRPELKARLDDHGSAGKLIDYVLTVGLAFGFGAPRSAAPVATAAAAPAPAPAPTVVAAPPPPPPPPPPPVVTGPIDSDGDNVTDDRDRCPGTPRGTAIDPDGCPRKGSITLSGVNFENNSAKLKPESFATLDTVAKNMSAYPRLKVEVQGHSDNTGADSYNLTLSQSRAESVREYLIGKGVGASQLTAKGYGESRPVADNKTADGRSQNRRVVLDVLDNPGDVEVKK